ncbi:DUF368 domain-containing protein [Fervidibacillus halotolerans]|uniref:DUF368 domain-containing protein n=1 Tax=Fervidibacillus halotolerans TaxID=2980027 RepID=A0A9E8S091_9BACI|nr:DUF368 domain-containing protein [Fervidibacillus halotolerans]WAA13979.1 DUF368 domain-containing protein [Fervidibacillus halotolerans]
MEWKNIYRGFLMGTSDLIPGVSGGTVAVMLGIYDQFLGAISGFFSKDWKRHLNFLIPLATGMLLAIFSLSRLIDWLLAHHYEETMFFFLGLIFGIIPYLVKEVDAFHNFSVKHYVVFLIGAIFVGSLSFFLPDKAGDPMTNITPLVLFGLFFSGWLASMAMLLPGISGSMVLLIVGAYPTVINALSNLDVPLIIVTGSGIVVGFVVSSKAIRYFLTRYPFMMYALIIGLIVGSIFVVFPGIPNGGMERLLSGGTLIIGFVISILLQSAEKK